MNAAVAPVGGWRAEYTGGALWWTQSESTMLPGTYCVQGNVSVSGSPGPVSASIIAQGSLVVSGSPVFTAPPHPEGLLFFAGGDVQLRGNTSTVYAGAIYARNQCDLAGNGSLNGTVMCLGETTAGPAVNLASTSAVAGSIRIIDDCSGRFARVRRIIGWYQSVN